MKKLANILILILAVGLSSCQNDGYIGDLFGTWRLDEYTLDGKVQKGQLVETTTFSFQNDIVYVVALKDEHQTHNEQFGTWNDAGETFTLNFTHSDSETEPGKDIYSAPTWIGMTSVEPMVMTVDERSSRDMTFRWVSPDGATHIYKLHKTW